MSDIYINSSRPTYFIYIGKVFPVNVVDNTQARQNLTSITYMELSDNIPYPIPDNPEIEKFTGETIIS